MHHVTLDAEASGTVVLAATCVDPRDCGPGTTCHHAVDEDRINARAILAADSLPSLISSTTNNDTTQPFRNGFRNVELKDAHGFNQFTLTYNEDHIAIVGPRMHLSLTKKDCNSQILQRFSSEMNGLVGKFIRRYGTEPPRTGFVMQDLRITIDGDTYISRSVSPTGHGFLHLLREVVRMKWEEKSNCSPDEGS